MSRGKRPRRRGFALRLRMVGFAGAHPRLIKYGAIAAVAVGLVLSFAVVYYYVSFARVIDARLHGERERVLPRVFGRPLEIRRGEGMTALEFVDRLNDLGYTERTRPQNPGEFSSDQGVIQLVARAGTQSGKLLSVNFQRQAPRPASRRAAARPAVLGNRIESLTIADGKRPIASVTLDTPMLTALTPTSREKRRQVPLASIPTRMVQAVLAIEDRRYYDHPGVDIIRTVGAALTNLKGDRPYLVGGSTITQQLVKNFFLTPEKSIKRKLLEQFMALVLDRRASKDDILELYLNDVYLGQRGSFAIHGVAEAARLYFGKDVSNITLGEAATIAGIIQAPATLSPFSAPDRALERRGVVLQAMVDANFISSDAAARASKAPLAPVARALEAEAPYFVDFVGGVLSERYPTLTQDTDAVDVYTSLDVHLQRLAQDAVREGLTRADKMLSRGRRGRTPQAALIALDPRTGDILAMVGGRSYNQSQFNRASSARRQPGSVFKPLVYLAAFERAAEEGLTSLTPATLVNDEPTTFAAGDTTWSPANYEDEYDGPITLRRALAMSRNTAAVKVAEAAGYDRIAGLWRRIGGGTPPLAVPSIALGVFETTPLEIATAYTLFPNGGRRLEPRAILRLVRGEEELTVVRTTARQIARPDTTYLVTDMMRSVLSEGTGAAVRASGFALDAAGKTGTTNDLRDAWFVGFTPELLTVVWVGLDENQALGLSGSQAALPIWTRFMTRALAGRPDQAFEVPDTITFAEIDRDTGALAGPGCLRVVREAFIAGTEPTQMCEVHKY